MELFCLFSIAAFFVFSLYSHLRIVSLLDQYLSDFLSILRNYFRDYPQ